MKNQMQCFLEKVSSIPSVKLSLIDSGSGSSMKLHHKCQEPWHSVSVRLDHYAFSRQSGGLGGLGIMGVEDWGEVGGWMGVGRGGSLLAPWHNWQTVWCHLTPRSPSINAALSLSSLVKREKKGRRVSEGGSHSSSLVRAWAKKLLHTERRISGSGSVNVGDRGIWGLKPSLSAFA